MKIFALPATSEPNLKQGVAHKVGRMYRPPVAANSANGFGDPIKLAHKRPKSIARRFFTSVAVLYGGCARDTFGYAGCQLSRFANLRTAVTQNRLATIHGGSTSQVGASPLQDAITHSAIRIRALAHRRMALSALRANSSLSVRLERYNAHMAVVRSLEAGGVQ